VLPVDGYQSLRQSTGLSRTELPSALPFIDPHDLLESDPDGQIDQLLHGIRACGGVKGGRCDAAIHPVRFFPSGGIAWERV
jgi:hypothetical protein